MIEHVELAVILDGLSQFREGPVVYREQGSAAYGLRHARLLRPHRLQVPLSPHGAGKLRPILACM